MARRAPPRIVVDSINTMDSEGGPSSSSSSTADESESKSKKSHSRSWSSFGQRLKNIATPRRSTSSTYSDEPRGELVKFGWLKKQGHLRKNWKHRYFYLYLFDDNGSSEGDFGGEKDANVVGVLQYWTEPPSTGGTAKGKLLIGRDTTVRMDPENEHLFTVVGSNNYIKLQADTPESRSAWAEALDEQYREELATKTHEKHVQVLSKGERFLLYTSTESSEEVMVMLTPDRKRIQWVGASVNFVMLGDILIVKSGHSSPLFQKLSVKALQSEVAPNEPWCYEHRCLSIVAQSKTLNLVAPAQQERDQWVNALQGASAYLQRTLQRSSLRQRIKILKESFSENIEEVEKHSRDSIAEMGDAFSDSMSLDTSSSPPRPLSVEYVDDKSKRSSSRLSNIATKAYFGFKKKMSRKSLGAVSRSSPPSRRKGIDKNASIAHAISEAIRLDVSSPPGNVSVEYATGLSKDTFREKIKYAEMRLSDNSEEAVFDFRVYAPGIFRAIRQMYGITNEAFAASMSRLSGGGVGEGKSGMLFFTSHDKNYVMKTVKESEKDFFFHNSKGVLRNYFIHLAKNIDSLLSRFYGLFKIRFNNGPWIVLICMNNAFHTKIPLHYKFDLKGSTKNRFVDLNKDETAARSKVPVLKDLNFKRKVYLDVADKDALMGQIRVDVDFLKKMKIMDYSLLLGISVDPVTAEGPEQGASKTVDPKRLSAVRRTRFERDSGGIEGRTPGFDREVYFVSIIDILQVRCLLLLSRIILFDFHSYFSFPFFWNSCLM